MTELPGYLPQVPRPKRQIVGRGVHKPSAAFRYGAAPLLDWMWVPEKGFRIFQQASISHIKTWVTPAGPCPLLTPAYAPPCLFISLAHSTWRGDRAKSQDGRPGRRTHQPLFCFVGAGRA